MPVATDSLNGIEWPPNSLPTRLFGRCREFASFSKFVTCGMDLAGRGTPADSAYSATQISRVSADTREKQERDAKVDVCNGVVTGLSGFG